MEMKLAENASLVPLGRITSIKFSLATPEEIVKASNSEPIQQSNQLCGPLLGLPTESSKCLSCGSFKFDECEGHFGHIRLPTAVYHPSRIQEVVRILGRICLNCFKLKKKKVLKSMKEVMEEKELANRVKKLDGMKNNKFRNYKRKGFCEARHNPIDSDTCSSSEEDPLLCSLIPTRLRDSSKIKNFEKQKSKNFKFTKEIGKAGMQQTKRSAVLGKRRLTTCMADFEYDKQEICKYCEDADKKSVKAYPNIKVKIAPVDNGTFKVIQMSSHKEVPPKFWNFVDKYSGCCSGNKSSRTLLPFEALSILRQIPETVSKGFGLSPEGLIWECLPVPPNCARISGVSFRTTRVGTDGVTQMLKKVINTVGRIRESRGSKPTFDTIKHETQMLQSLCSEYLQAQGGSKVIGDKEFLAFHDHNNGKTKSVSSLWGERIEAFLKKTSGFSSRGIISGDAYREIDQIGVPLQVANAVTVEERVTDHNIDKMQTIVSQGLYTLLIDRGGNRRSKEFIQTEKVIEIGEIVHRQLADGDIVFVNRPPSIHKHSFLALKVCIQPSCNFSISPLICPPLDADFDGDCIHVFVPQTLQSRAELSQLLTLEQQLIDSQGGQILLMLTQDTLLAASLILSMPFLNQIAMDQLSIWTSSAVPKPAIFKSPNGGPYWTGCQLFQMCLPPDIYCIGNGLNIYKSEILSIHRSAKKLSSSIELILHTLILQKGPSEALNFLNLAQHCLTEWLSQQGLSVGLDDVHPFHESSHKKDLIESIKECVADATPLLKHKTIPCFEDAIVPYLQDRVSEAYNRVQKHFSNSNSLIATVDAGSGRSLNKVAQQTEFLGLQLFKGKELIPKEWSNRIFTSLNISTPLSYEVNVCEAHGLIVSSIANGLKPHQAFIHAVSSRETLFCKAIEVKEPGTLFKKLMSFLRDIVICYDGTCRTTQGKHLVQFKYDCNVSPKDSESKKLSSEWECKNTEIKIQLQPGEPVGVLAATAIANPSYKILLDGVQRNISSWHLLKETLFRGFGTRLKLSDQTVILRLQSCVCKGAYCLEKTALQIQQHLQKLPLKLFSVSIKIGYWDTGTMKDFADKSLLIRSAFVGHVHLDEGLLKEANLSIDSLLLNLNRSIKSKKHPLFHLSDRLILWISERCTGAEKSEEINAQMPCLHFFLETSDYSHETEDTVDILVNVICPKLMETTAKGDDRIQSLRVSWSPVDSASWVPLQIGLHQSVEGEIAIEAIVEKSEVKQSGDAWKIIHEACLPLMGSLNTSRCIPYSINEIYKYFGISAAYYILLQRLCHSVNSIGSHVYKEHLILISNCMCSSGKIIGFTAGGYRHLLERMGMSAPFAEAGMQRPLKCFEKAAERGQEDTLSSTLACCSWGQYPLLGTGGNFDVLWNNKEASSDLSDQLCNHGDVYDFLENIGIIPYKKEGSSSGFHLDENIYGETDDTSEFMSSDVIFVDSPREKGVANFNGKDFIPLCDLSAKFPDQIDGNAKISNFSAWEASTVSESQTDGWVCNAKVNEETSDRKSGSQSKVAGGWETNSTLVDGSTNAIIFNGQGSGWTPNVHSLHKRDFKSSWLEETITDVQGQNLRSEATGEVNSTGGFQNHEICSRRKVDNRNCMLEPKNKSGWDGLQETKVENLAGWKSNAETAGVKCKHEKKQGESKSQEDEITNASSWNSNLMPERGRDYIGGWMKTAGYSKSKEDGWKCHDQKSVWEVDLQESYVSNDSGWYTKVETAGRSNCTDRWKDGVDSNVSNDENWKSASISKKRAAGTNCTSTYSVCESNKDSRNIQDSEIIHQEEVTKVHDNEQNPCKPSRFQKCITFQRKGNKTKKNVEANNNMQCRRKETALQEPEDLDFPPGFSSVKDSYREKTVSLQQIENDTTFPSCTNISQSSRWKDHANEQGEIKSDATLKSKRTGANLVPLGKRSHRAVQCEEQNKTTSQDVEQGRRTSEEAQATGWSVDWQADVPETSWTTQETRVKEAQTTGWSMYQRISEETQATGWSVDRHAEVPKTSSTTPETMAKRQSEDRNLNKNVLEQEHIGHDNTKEPSSAGNLASPVWLKLPKREQDECKPSYSGSNHKFKPTGANIVPIGTRSHKRTQSKRYEKSPIEEEHLQDQGLSKDMQPKEWGINNRVEEGSYKSCTAGEPDGGFKHSESNTQKALFLGETPIFSVDLHTPRIFSEDTLMNSISNLETKKKVVMTVTELGSEGWNPRPGTIAVRSSLERWNNEHVACHSNPAMTSDWGLTKQSDPTKTSGRGLSSQSDPLMTSDWELPSQGDPLMACDWELPSQSDPLTACDWELPSQSDTPTKSGWKLPNQSDPPTTSGWELQNHSADKPNAKLCMMKSMEDARPGNDKSAISSLRSTKRNRVHLDHTNLSASSTRNNESLKERVIDRPSKQQELMHEINSLMHSMRIILHYNSYNSGDRLRPEDEREVLEKVFIHHPEAEAKMGCGVDFVMVDNHTELSSTRCFYIVRKDGTRTDFSYLKCLRGLVEKKCPDSAKDFIKKYLKGYRRED